MIIAYRSSFLQPLFSVCVNTKEHGTNRGHDSQHCLNKFYRIYLSITQSPGKPCINPDSHSYGDEYPCCDDQGNRQHSRGSLRYLTSRLMSIPVFMKRIFIAVISYSILDDQL